MSPVLSDQRNMSNIHALITKPPTNLQLLPTFPKMKNVEEHTRQIAFLSWKRHVPPFTWAWWKLYASIKTSLHCADKSNSFLPQNYFLILWKFQNEIFIFKCFLFLYDIYSFYDIVLFIYRIINCTSHFFYYSNLFTCLSFIVEKFDRKAASSEFNKWISIWWRVFYAFWRPQDCSSII